MTETQAALPDAPDTDTRSVRNAVAQRQQDPPSFVVAKAHSHRIAEVLPDHIEVKPFLGSAFAALNRTPDLMKAANNSPGAFMDALTLCASLGHMPGGKEFYLTARRSKHHGGKEIIVGLEGYRGVVERMYRSGAVASVIVREVCQGDRFRFVEGEDEQPVHEVDWFSTDVDRSSPESIIGVYAYAHLTTGAVSRVVVLNRRDLEKAKKDSDAGRADKGPWVDHYRAMVLKTAAHRLEPWVPTSAEYRREQLRAAAAASSVPRGVDGDTGEILDGDIVDADLVGES
jgi:recombination protein RecT